MLELEKKTPVKKRTTATVLPSVAWPTLYVRNKVTQGDMFPEQGWVFAAYIVPIKDAGLEKLLLLYGGFNWWLDNNCCRGAGFSSVRVNQAIIHTDEWFPYVELPGPAGRLGKNVLRDPARSPVPHVRTYEEDFPELTPLQADIWFAGVLMSALIGQTSHCMRGILRTVDKRYGLTQLAMRLISTVPTGYTPIESSRTTAGGVEAHTNAGWSVERGTKQTTGSNLAAYTAAVMFPKKMTRAHKTSKYKFQQGGMVTRDKIAAVLRPEFKGLVTQTCWYYGGASYLKEGCL